MALALLLRPRPVATEAVGSARAFESVPSRASPLRVAGQERWCLGAGTLPCKKAAPARTSLRPSVCVCLSARAAPGGPGVLGRDTMITGLRRRSHKTLSFCPPDRPHPRPAIRHAWRKWCTAPNDNRDRSIGARLVVALPRGRGRGPAASQTVGALSFLLVWQRVASSQPPMARRQHAGAVQSCLCVVAQRVHTEHRRPFICALSLDATLPPCLVPKASSTLRSKAHPARSARRRDQVKA